MVPVRVTCAATWETKVLLQSPSVTHGIWSYTLGPKISYIKFWICVKKALLASDT